jgi:hypothetical protein
MKKYNEGNELRHFYISEQVSFLECSSRFLQIETNIYYTTLENVEKKK